jgi:hypothetical protein
VYVGGYEDGPAALSLRRNRFDLNLVSEFKGSGGGGAISISTFAHAAITIADCVFNSNSVVPVEGYPPTRRRGAIYGGDHAGLNRSIALNLSIARTNFTDNTFFFLTAALFTSKANSSPVISACAQEMPRMISVGSLVVQHASPCRCRYKGIWGPIDSAIVIVVRHDMKAQHRAFSLFVT